MSTLFLKYRPQTFDTLVGQSSVRRTLQNALKAERPSHAYLFAGVRGTGKTSTARIFAKGLNCEALSSGDPCGKCSICEATADGSLVDVIEIDAASNRGIDEMRDLREKINFAPSTAKRKVYIIDEVHMLTKEAFNALLKTLEEPPEHAFFCLATTEMHKIPQTIISRCQVFTFNRFSIDQLVDRLKYIGEQEEFTCEDEALHIIARKAEGGMRDAISLLEQVAAETEGKITTANTQESLGVSSSEVLEQLLESVQSNNAEKGLEIIRSLSKQGVDFRNFGHDFLGFLREKMLIKVAKSEDVRGLLQCIEAFEKALSRLKTSPIMELPLEIAIIELCQGQKSSTLNAPIKAQEDKKIETPERQHQNITQPAAPTTAAVSTPPTPQPEKKTEEIKLSPTPAKAAASNTQTPAINQGSTQINVAQVKSQMKEIADKAGLPAFVKKSFLTTIPDLENGQLVFMTDSEFHREKLDTPSHKGLIQKAICDMFNETVQIAFIKKAIQRPTKTPGTSTNNNEEKVSAEDFLVF